MRPGFLVAAVCTLLAPGALTAAEADKTTVELRSDVLVTGLPMAECPKGVHGIRLTAQVDRKGEGSGTLELDPNAPAYDELGFQTAGGNVDPIRLECTLKLAKKKKIMLRESPRIGAPLVEVEWVIIAVRGPKITSRLFLATEDKTWGSYSRLVVHDENGKVRYAVRLTTPPPPPPCHPGCFPVGTSICTPGGSQPIERLREGDTVTTVGPGEVAAPARVVAVFATKNRLVEVRTEAGNLVTTETQPLVLADGGLRAAGDLKPGDRVVRWDGRARRPVTVRSVSATGRQERVFNLILGDPSLFVADGFLVRSKPPATAATALP